MAPFDCYKLLITRHARKALLILTGITLLMGVCAMRLRTDNAIETWLLDDDPRKVSYQQFVEIFGTEEFVLVVFSDEDLFSRASFQQLHHLSQRLKDLKGISRVWSLSEIYHEILLQLPPGGRLSLEDYAESVVGHPLFTGNLVSEDGSTTAVVAVLTPEAVKDRRGIVNAIRQAATEACPDKKLYFAGPPVMSAELDRIATRDPRIFTPVVVLFTSAILFVLFRCRGGVRIPLAIAGMSIVWTLGIFSLMGGTMNLVLAVAPPLILVAAVEDSIFLLCQYQNRVRERSPIDAVMESVRDLWRPCLMTTLTTAIGFGSLALSRFTPIRSFGILSALGVGFAFIITMVFVPASIICKRGAGMPLPRIKTEEQTGKILTCISRANTAHPGLILLLFTIGTIMSLAGASRLNMEANTLKFFRADSEIRRTYAFIEKHLTGLSPFEILLQGRDVTDPATLAAIDRIEDYLEQQPFVTHSFSVRDLQAGIRGGHPIPPASEGLKVPALFNGLKRSFMNPNGTVTHISGRGLTMNSILYERAMDEIEAFTWTVLPEGVTARLTGVVPMITSMDRYLLVTLIRSFASSSLIISVLMAYQFRSIRLGLLSMIPNVVPIVATLGIMGLLRIDLSPATATVASISLGIAVDSEIHYLHRYAVFLAMDADQASARNLTTAAIGRPTTYSIFTLMVGFSVMGLSNFGPTRYFGLLSGLCLALGLLCDLFLLPALLTVFGPGLRAASKTVAATKPSMVEEFQDDF